MSKDAIEVIRRGWEAYERGDVTAMLADISDEIVVHQHPPIPDADTYYGREGLLQSLLDWAEGFDELDQKAEEFIDAGDGQIIVRVHQTAQLAGSDVPVEGVFWFLFTVKEGKTVRFDLYNDKDQALEAAGLSE